MHGVESSWVALGGLSKVGLGGADRVGLGGLR